MCFVLHLFTLFLNTCAYIHTYFFVFFDGLSGIRSWDTNLIDCNLDQELKLFVSRHSARFSADVKGKPEIKKKKKNVDCKLHSKGQMKAFTVKSKTWDMVCFLW